MASIIWDKTSIIRDKRVFLSGPMTGIEHHNADAFVIAHAICSEHCAKHVYNPAEEWLNPKSYEAMSRTHEGWMLESIAELTKRRGCSNDPLYDYLVLLPGWSESDGAHLEYDVALACGIKVIDLCDIEDGE